MKEVEDTARLGGWPGQAALVAVANIFSINVAVLQGGDKGNLDIQHISPFQTESEEDQGSIVLAYLYNGHYDAVVDEPAVENFEYQEWMKDVEYENRRSERCAKELQMNELSSVNSDAVAEDRDANESKATGEHLIQQSFDLTAAYNLLNSLRTA